MVWRNVGAILLTDQWQYTLPVYGNIFRLNHVIRDVDSFYGRALICQSSFSGGNPELFQIKKVYPKRELDVYEFAKPEIFIERRLALRLSQGSRIGVTRSWQIIINEDYYDPDKHFTYIQSSPETQWYVTHDLERYPYVTTFNEFGEIIEGEVRYINTREIVIYFSQEMSGRVELD